MDNTAKHERNRIYVVDMGEPRVSDWTEQLLALKPGGQSCVHEHSGKTRFSVWIATRRHRLNLPLRWRSLGNNRYEIWLETEAAMVSA